MHARVWLAVLALGAVMVPSGSAHHEEGYPHVNPFSFELEPGQTEVIPLSYDAGPFLAGWVFVLTAFVDEGAVAISLVGPAGPVAQWDFLAGEDARSVTTLMPDKGNYSLSLANAGGGNASIHFFYDQSCNCAMKPIPPEIPRGLVVFNLDVTEGAHWQARFPEPPVHSTVVKLAYLTGAAGSWPEDFRVIETSERPILREGALVHEFDFVAEKSTRVYFFMQSIEADMTAFDRSSPLAAVQSVAVTPEYERLQAGGQEAPGLSWGAGLLVLAGVAFARRVEAP